MALIDDFKARFPEFDSDEVDAAWSGLEAYWPCFYGGAYGSNDCEDQKVLYLIAHLFTVNKLSGSAKTSTSDSVADVSSSWLVSANMSDQESFFSSTKYGQQFYMMIRNRFGAVFV